jgi:macrolide transport system ATP-binding/permease protein
MSTLMQDLRYGGRRLRQSPGFALVCVITLALGSGANTAIFTLVHAVMLKSLPVTNPKQLYRLGNENNCCVIGGMQDSGRYTPIPCISSSAITRPSSARCLPSRRDCRR